MSLTTAASEDPVCISGISRRDAMIAIYTGKLRGLIAEEKRDKLLPEPKTVTEALTGPDQRQMEGARVRSTTHSQTRNVFTLEELPPGRRAIGVKWIMKVKLNA